MRFIAWLVMIAVCLQWVFPSLSPAMSIPEEIKLGQKILKDAQENLKLVDDYLANRVVQEVGQRLMQQAGETPFDFHFIVFKSDAANAFNVPGGLVFLTSGLLAFVGDEDELAGVMAHEITHGMMRHVSQMMAQQTKLQIVTLMAMILGAVLAGSASGAQASTAIPMATAQSLALKYSREHEEEADTGGLTMMAKAGFAPQAMVRLMKRFQQESTLLPDVPRYLLTHPLEDVRMARMETLLQGISVSASRPDAGKEYGKIRARMIVMEQGTDAAVRRFQSILASDPGNADALFGLGVALREKGDFYAAATALYQASTMNYGSAEILKELGRCYFEWGRFQEALRTLLVALKLDDEDTDALFYLGRAHEEISNNTDALSAFRKLEGRDPGYHGLYFHMGRVYDRMGKKCMAHYCLGQHFRLIGNAKMEKFHFDQVEKLQKQGNCGPDDTPPPRPKENKERKEKNEGSG